MHPCESLRISYEPCDSFTNNLPNLLRISCECYKYLRMPLQTLRMLANALRMKRLQSACLPILFLCHLFASIHRVKLYYFVFVWKRQVSLACPSAEERGKGKPDHPLLITKLFPVSNLCRQNAPFVKVLTF